LHVQIWDKLLLRDIDEECEESETEWLLWLLNSLKCS
jgi:hypothetical protein